MDGASMMFLGVPTLSPSSLVHTPCCTVPKSPLPRVLHAVMESAGMMCLLEGRGDGGGRSKRDPGPERGLVLSEPLVLALVVSICTEKH